MKKIFVNNLIKGIANVELTPQFVFEAGRAAAYVIGKQTAQNPKILIGKDTRISGDMIEAALTAAFCSLGVQVHIVGVMPTAAVSYLVKKYNMDAGVVITAADDPVEYNGIKFLNSNGNEISAEMENEIEQYIFGNKKIDICPQGADLGKVSRHDMGVRDYVDHIKDHTDGDFCGFKIAVDCGNGTAYQCAKLFFRELDANVTIINNRPNGVNINSDCGLNNTSALREYIIQNNCDFGFAYDGEAVCLGVLDKKGIMVDGCKVFDFCMNYVKQQNTGIDAQLLKNDALMLSAQFVCALKKSGKSVSDLLDI